MHICDCLSMYVGEVDSTWYLLRTLCIFHDTVAHFETVSYASSESILNEKCKTQTLIDSGCQHSMMIKLIKAHKCLLKEHPRQGN